MDRLSRPLQRLLAILLTAVAVTGFCPATASLTAKTGSIDDQNDLSWSLTAEPGYFIIQADDTGSSCRDATPEESNYFNERSPDLALSPIDELRAQADEGLHITLRATTQLDSFPAAKAAFLKAAAQWEQLIQSPISIVVDVDFGPARFGQPYSEGVLGATGAQSLFNSVGYTTLRNRLIAGTSDPQKFALYSALRNPSITTDGGDTTAMVATSATLRMMGEIPSIANPLLETNLGNPPSIGFNSAFNFDFDPTDGIAAGKLDFDSVAVHEIGHALGFTSLVGARELTPASPLAVSAWDVFRFRPGITLNDFTAAQRVQSSGGEQVFFFGGSQLALSSGRPNGTGGDGRQASHWKDDMFSGQYTGVMDPTLRNGFRAAVTANDLAALDAIGYRLKPASQPNPPPAANNPPAINSVTGRLIGDSLVMNISAADQDGDLAQAQVTLLNQSNGVVTQLQPITLSSDPSPIRTLTLTINGMGQFPAALKMTVALVDRRSNRSGVSTFDFSGADSGGPDLRSASFNSGGPMILKGGPFTGALQLEINGVIVTPPLRIKIKGGAKLKIAGSQSEFNLRSGANRIRLLGNGLRSSIFLLTI